MKIERKFAAGAVQADPALGARQIRVVASTPTPDRAGDVMAPKGCDFVNYAKNPIVLADHDPSLPIGVAKLTVGDDKVEALIDFAPEGVSAKADEYCGLAKAGILNAVSVGFRSIDREPNKATGGYRFNKWELMELSLVAVPCNPEALVVTRSAKSNDGEAWKVGASRNLPIGDDGDWDGPEAEKSIFDHCQFDGDNPDTSFARKGFLAYDAGGPGKKGSYKLPFAQMVDGRLTAMPAGVRAAASRLPQADLPQDVADKARAVLDHYEAKMKESDGGKTTAGAVRKGGFVVKGLWDVACLAELLQSLGWQHDRAVWEREIEGDESKVPEMLADALRQLADAFLAMSTEETRELLAGHGVQIDEEDEIVELAGKPQIKAWRAARRKAGAVLSAQNRDHLDAIKKCMKSAAACQAAMSNLHVKAADLHDDLKQHIEDMQQHIETATEHAKAMGKKKPASATEGDEAQSDDGDNTDVELSVSADYRKRQIEILALA